MLHTTQDYFDFLDTIKNNDINEGIEDLSTITSRLIHNSLIDQNYQCIKCYTNLKFILNQSNSPRIIRDIEFDAYNYRFGYCVICQTCKNDRLSNPLTNSCIKIPSSTLINTLFT